jgi:competence protein ComEC
MDRRGATSRGGGRGLENSVDWRRKTVSSERMNSRSLGHRAPLLWLVLPFIAGLAAGQAGGVVRAAFPLGIALGLVLAAFAAWRWQPRLWGPALVGAMFCAGLASQALHRFRPAAWETLPPREARLALAVDRVFAAKESRRVSGLATVVRSEAHLSDLLGQRVYFSLTLGRGEAPPIRSAVVAAVGVIVTLPRDPPAESFESYLAGAGIHFRLTRGRVLTVERPAHRYYQFCARAAERFKAILDLGIAEKRPALAVLLRGMMLGEKHEMSDEQRTIFMQSGSMHLFAISGLNIGVIAGALQALLSLARVPRWPRFVIGVALLWLFVDITGASPSAVRAWAMAAFLQAALVLERPANVLAGLVASALVVALVAPLQVFSASFVMSYAIVLALLLLGLPLGDAWLARWEPWRELPRAAWTWWQRQISRGWRLAAGALAIGMATMGVGLLTGLQYFQLLTPGALIANLILIPAAGVVTLGGFASLICGLAGLGAGAVLCNHAAALVLLAIEWLLRIGVEVPGAFFQARFAAPWIGPAALTVLLATLLVGYSAGWRKERGGWWPPVAVVVLTLVLGVRFGAD